MTDCISMATNSLQAKDKIVRRLFDWFTEQEPRPFELEDFQAICMDAGLMDDWQAFTDLGRHVFELKS